MLLQKRREEKAAFRYVTSYFFTKVKDNACQRKMPGALSFREESVRDEKYFSIIKKLRQRDICVSKQQG